jgi:hypothetical protein
VASVDTVPPYDRYQRMHTLPGLTADEDGPACTRSGTTTATRTPMSTP